MSLLIKKILQSIKNMQTETIENENGTAIKFSDGTMICTGTGQCPSGVGYAEIVFPSSFIDKNYIITANHKYNGNQGGSPQLRNITNPQAVDNNSAYIYSYLYDATVANYIRDVQYIAIGRWK